MKIIPQLCSLFIFAITAFTQHGIYFDCHNPDINPKHIDHPHVDGVFLRFRWSEIEPEKGKFNFTAVEQNITPWVKAGKKVLLGFPLAGQHNLEVPDWAEKVMPAIEFIRNGKNTDVRVPKYWDAKFLPMIAPMINALGARYDNDNRIEAVMVSVAHIGFITAAPNSGGAEAFFKAGWTPKIWKDYCSAMIQLYRQAFSTKPLFLRGGELIVRAREPAKFGFPEHKPHFTDLRDEILSDAALNYGISIGCNGLQGDVQGFLDSGIPALYERLAPGAREGRYVLELADDWPLWVNPERRAKSGVDRKSDNAYFKKCLDNAAGVTPGLPKLPIAWIKMLETDLDCTHPGSKDYQKDCEEKLIWFKTQLLSPVTPRLAAPGK